MIWTILGVSVAVVAVFCVSVAELLVGHPIFELHREYIAGALVLGGVAAWFVGRYLAQRRKDDTDESTRLFVLFDLRYWGPMLVVLGVITLFIQTIALKAQPRIEAAKPVEKSVEKKIEVVAEPAKPAGPVTFPPLHIKGLIIHPGSAIAIIDGGSYSVGDRVGDVTVKEITRAGVTVEKLGQSKLISLR